VEADEIGVAHRPQEGDFPQQGGLQMRGEAIVDAFGHAGQT
jgi:hypothetical protein